MRTSVAVLVLTLATGCGHVVDGEAHPATEAIAVLPTEAELSDAVGNGLSTFDFRPFVGGPEIMPDGFRDDADASPFRCIGVTETMLRATYEGADVLEAARQSYFTLAEGAVVSGADAAVVRFGSDAAAQDRYREFTEQWRSCDGTTVVKHLGGAGADVSATITDVVIDGPVLSATVSTRQASGTDARYLRAVDLRGAAIVEVSLAVTGSADSAAAVGAARVMTDKLPD